jgi:hypothetical protein
MFARGSFFALIVMPSASDAVSRTISPRTAPRSPPPARGREPRVLSETASIEEERHAVPIADRAHRTEVLERHRLAAARVVRDRDEDDGNIARALREQSLEGLGVHVSLEGMERRRVAALGDRQIERLGARVLDVRARRVEVRVVRDDLPGPAENREEDALGRTPPGASG